MKKILLALPFIFVTSVVANANVDLGKGISLGASGELDLITKYNNPVKKNSSEYQPGFAIVPEVAITINIDGKHENNFGNVVWRLAQKVATDYRYDTFGQREAWLGLENKLGTLTIGNQMGLVYLAIDGFSIAGTGNTFSDIGAHSLQYTRAAMYKTPSFANTSLAVQTNLPSTIDIENENSTTTVANQYAVDVLLNHDGQAFKYNLGYSYGKNGRMNANLLATDFSSTSRGSYNNTMGFESNNSVAFASASYTHSSGMMIAGAFKHDNLAFYNISPNVDKNTLNNNSVLALMGYKFGNNKVTVGYTHIFDATIDTEKAKGSNLNQVAAQYDRILADNVSMFISGRYQVIDDVNALGLFGNGFDGQVANKKDSGRILIGLYAQV